PERSIRDGWRLDTTFRLRPKSPHAQMRIADMKTEWTRYYHYGPRWHQLEVLHAHFVSHTFARHSHDYFVIGYVESGVQAYTYRRARHITPPGHVFLVNPGEVHTGEAATRDGYVYRTMYPRTTLMEQVARETAGTRRLPLFKDAVLRDPVVSHALTRFHRELAGDGSRLAMESWLLSALTRLICRHADRQRTAKAIGRERIAVRRAREYLDEHFASDVSLARLGTVAGLSPFHLARAFAREVGLPPHVYLETVRIARARALLSRARPIAEVALDVGYADQSHFTHRFKRLVGIAPGQYLRERTRSISARGHATVSARS
ncbi:MAG: AraC family ligand binding domain-containing protein, partial [Vicinamibacteraceae bacterium]